MFKVFRRRTSERFHKDDFGEWILVNGNAKLSLMDWALRKAFKKAGCNSFDFYVLHFEADEELNSLLGIKGMTITKINISNDSFSKAISQTLKDYGVVGEIRLNKLRACGNYYTFFSFDLLLKRLRKVNSTVKLLLPPLGVNSREIPYTLESLFTSILEYGSNAMCKSGFEMNDELTKINAICNDYIGVDNFNYSLSYFSQDDFRVFVKRMSSRSIEVQATIKNFNKKALIPLLWDNFLATYVSC
ncbi:MULTISPECIES: hypothetical protein [Acidianus]|uniref:Uncharacterized protein n=1 Tax=Candidatus Acidianus copahuensis TaxID=1160895 RepID=A0A031LN78_9CREN|nr:MULTISPECIES: hypothetical protein [Acidianus]EZQ07108.1 hypothetical protein CM19_06035 [Candidatus Acidianus copahuensis]NON63379.1 hypothetical protein [Acidianus sp. RZ1]